MEHITDLDRRCELCGAVRLAVSGCMNGCEDPSNKNKCSSCTKLQQENESLRRERDELKERDKIICEEEFLQRKRAEKAEARVKELEGFVRKANGNHEHFEREWYLVSNKLEDVEAELKTANEKIDKLKEMYEDCIEMASFYDEEDEVWDCDCNDCKTTRVLFDIAQQAIQEKLQPGEPDPRD